MKRVTAIFATRVVALVLSLFTSVIIARLLGPDNRGAFVAVATLPGMLSALAMFGLPNSVNYFAGRGHSIASLIRASLLFTALISAVLIAAVWVCLPWFEQSILMAAPDDMARVMLFTLPAGMLASFGGTLLYGRQQVRVYNLILVGQGILTLASSAILLGVFHLGVPGAVITSILVSTAMAIGVMAEVARLRRRDTGGEPARLRALVSYGARLYPASLTGYFNYRADTYIVQALAASKAVAERSLGLYGFAVTMAEVVFLVPESVATMFLPRVAGGTPQEASAALGRVTRLTLLSSSLLALALIPAAFVGIRLVLPDYVDCLPAFVAILPGVVFLSIAKIMTSYLGGRGRPGPISMAAMFALVVNVAANIVLIPIFGIVGASLSSVISYSMLAILVTVAASRASGISMVELCVPRLVDLRLLVSIAIGIVRRVVARLNRVPAPKAV